jgi:hypothetical protein
MDQNRRDYADLDLPPPRRIDWVQIQKKLRGMIIPALVLCVPAAFFAGMIAGRLSESFRQHHARFERERDAFVPFVTSDPAFSRVRIHEYSGGGIDVSGEVDSSVDLQWLRGEFVRLFGEVEIWRFAVRVGPAAG